MSKMADAYIDAEAYGFDLDDPRTLTRVLAVRAGTQAIQTELHPLNRVAPEVGALTVVRGLIREGLI